MKPPFDSALFTNAYMSPCLIAQLWLFEYNPEDIIDFQDQGLKALGNLATYYQSDNMTQHRRINTKARNMLRSWLNLPADKIGRDKITTMRRHGEFWSSRTI